MDRKKTVFKVKYGRRYPNRCRDNPFTSSIYFVSLSKSLYITKLLLRLTVLKTKIVDEIFNVKVVV